MKGKFKLNHLIVHLILLVGVIVVVFPFAWMILTSFKTSGEAMKIPPTIFPEKIRYNGISYHCNFCNSVCNCLYEYDHYHRGYHTGTDCILLHGRLCVRAYRISVQECNLHSGVICTDGTWTDLPSATVSDCSETGTAGYDPGTVSAKPVQRVRYFPAETVLHVSAERTGRSSHCGRMRTFPYLRTDHAAADQTGYRGNVHLYHQVCME